MGSKFVSKTTKEKIYRIVIRATIMYACKTWVLKKSDEEELER